MHWCAAHQSAICWAVMFGCSAMFIFRLLHAGLVAGEMKVKRLYIGCKVTLHRNCDGVASFAMKTERAIRHFGSVRALADAMNVSRQSVWAWKKKGQLPKLQALLCQQLMEARNAYEHSRR